MGRREDSSWSERCRSGNNGAQRTKAPRHTTHKQGARPPRLTCLPLPAVVSVQVLYNEDQLSIEIKSRKTGQSRMLKAPTEREYLAWCQAFQQVTKTQAATQAAAGAGAGGSKEHTSGAGGHTLDALHTREINRLRHSSASHEHSQSQSQSYQGQGNGAASFGHHQTPMRGGAGGAVSSVNPLTVGASMTPAPIKAGSSGSTAPHRGDPLDRDHHPGAAQQLLSRPHSTPSTLGGSTSPHGVPRLATTGQSMSMSQLYHKDKDSLQVPGQGSAAKPQANSLAHTAAASSGGGAAPSLNRAVSSPNSPPTDVLASYITQSSQQQPSSASSLGVAPVASASPSLNVSPESVGYAAQPSASPMHHPKSLPPPSLAASGGGGGGGVVKDVLRKYSQPLLDPSPLLRSASPSLRSGQPQDPLLMVVVEGGPMFATTARPDSKLLSPSPPASAADPTPCLLLANNLSWNASVSIPACGFMPGSTLVATLGNGARVQVAYELFKDELAGGLKSGSKVVTVAPAAAGSASPFSPPVFNSPASSSLSPVLSSPGSASEPRSYQVLLSWRVSSAKLPEADRRDIGIAVALPIIFVMLLLSCALAGHLSPSLLSCLTVLAGLAFVAHASLARHKSFIVDRQQRRRWEVTFVSLIEQPSVPGSNPSSALSTPLKTRSGSSGNLASSPDSGSRLKKKGILRRRANDLPDGHAAHVPLHAHSTEGALHDFEMSEYEDTGAGTSRENSQMGGGVAVRRHRRPTSTASSGASSFMASSSGDELEAPSSRGEPEATASAPPPKQRLAPSQLQQSAASSGMLHASPPPTSGAEVIAAGLGDIPGASARHDRAISSESDYHVVSGASSGGGSEEKQATLRTQSSHSGISSHSSSHNTARTPHAHGRFDAAESDGGEPMQTDAESRGLSDDDDDDDDTPGRAVSSSVLDEAAMLDLLHSYEDAPTARAPTDAMPDPHPAPWGSWSEDDTSKLVVRGPHFLDDKIKIPVGVPIFKLKHVDMFYTAQSNPNLTHVASRPGNWGRKYLERRQEKWEQMHAKASAAAASDGSTPSVSSLTHPASPLFIMNFLFPGPANKNMNLVLYFVRRVRPADELKKRREAGIGASGSGGFTTAVNSRRASGNSSPLDASVQATTAVSDMGAGSMSSPSPTSADSCPFLDIPRVASFDSLLVRFLDGPDDFRDSRLKIIPRIAEGPWLVRKGVGCVPAILGKKVQQLYFRDADPKYNYMEVVADVSSSMVAGRILALVKGAATALTIDLSFTLQGESVDELPESLLGGVRILHCNLDGLLEIDAHEEWLENVWLKQEKEKGRW